MQQKHKKNLSTYDIAMQYPANETNEEINKKKEKKHTRTQTKQEYSENMVANL